MVTLKKIRKSYPMGSRRLEVLKGIDLHVRNGEFVSIMGSSGSGKTTLLNIIGILDDFDSGEYSLDGLPIKDLSPQKAAFFRSRFLAFVFQSFNLILYKTALENVALPLYYQKVERKERQRIALDYLDRVGLKDWADHSPGELSGGQQQRVAIARALITRPKVILADEPTGELDSETSYQVIELLEEVNRGGITVLIVTHEHDIAERTKRTIRIKDGIIG